MTVTTFTAKLEGDGASYHGSIFWDKYTPKKLVATICRHLTPNTVGYPVWKSSASYGRDGQEKLVLQMKNKGARLGLKWVSGSETKYARALDPSGRQPES